MSKTKNQTYQDEPVVAASATPQQPRAKETGDRPGFGTAGGPNSRAEPAHGTAVTEKAPRSDHPAKPSGNAGQHAGSAPNRG